MYPTDQETLWCEQCGESAVEVRSTHAGLCSECYAASVQEAVKEHLGDDICGRPMYRDGKFAAICCEPYGLEHDHG